MIDKVTLVCDYKPPQPHRAKKGPFEQNGLTFFPRYKNGQLINFEAQVKNLRLMQFPDKVHLVNSLHKFHKGNNYTDFHKSDLIEAIDAISDLSGIDWRKATVKKLEYGCNVFLNASPIIHSLQSYKGKDYLPMARSGIRYGAYCEFAQYKIKGYDKTFEVKCTDKINIQTPIFRWEIQVNKLQYLNQLIHPPLSVKCILTDKILFALAHDAVRKYQNSIKMQQLSLHKLTAGQKKIIAMMHSPEIRKDFRIHHKETYKNNNRIYRQITQNRELWTDDTAQKLAAKFEDLLNG